MKTFRKHVGLVVPLDQENVDTDAIIPKQFLTSVDRTGFGRNLFDGWRYLDAWTAEGDPKKRRLNPDFALNQPRYSGASILLTQRNFGCGSSREHASWALVDAGFRVIIAPSFADIFCNNCFKNGLLPVTLPEQRVSALFQKVWGCPGFRLAVDLESQTICPVIAQQYTLPTRVSAEEVDFFDIDPFRKDRLLKGLDDVGATLAHEENIRAYEGKYRAMYPWL